MSGRRPRPEIGAGAGAAVLRLLREQLTDLAQPTSPFRSPSRG